MIILIPMGGHGSRFSDAGYKTNKACIPVTDRHTGKKLPMIVCAMKDIHGIKNKKNTVICVDRKLHEKNGTEKKIKYFFPYTKFIHDHVLLDQAFGCFLAREYLESDDQLFIGTCDNGFKYDKKKFLKLKKIFDVLMISHTNDENIRANPDAHSWANIKNKNQIKSISIKKTVSKNPMNDHATTGMFWFKKSNFFLKNLEKMIWNKDTYQGKYYVDKVLNYCIKSGLKVGYFDVEYISWGTPYDYEIYEKTYSYWKKFLRKEKNSD